MRSRPPRLDAARAVLQFQEPGCAGKPINYGGLPHSIERECDVKWLRCITPLQGVFVPRPSPVLPSKEINHSYHSFLGCLGTVVQPSSSHDTPIPAANCLVAEFPFPHSLAIKPGTQWGTQRSPFQQQCANSCSPLSSGRLPPFPCFPSQCISTWDLLGQVSLAALQGSCQRPAAECMDIQR